MIRNLIDRFQSRALRNISTIFICIWLFLYFKMQTITFEFMLTMLNVNIIVVLLNNALRRRF
jgi:hypothetical protein